MLRERLAALALGISTRTLRSLARHGDISYAITPRGYRRYDISSFQSAATGNHIQHIHGAHENITNEETEKQSSNIYALIIVNLFLINTVFDVIWPILALLYWMSVTYILHLSITTVMRSGWCMKFSMIVMITSAATAIISSLSISDWNIGTVYVIQTLLLILRLIVISGMEIVEHEMDITYPRERRRMFYFVVWICNVLVVVITVISLWKGMFSVKLTGIHSVCFAFSVFSIDETILDKVIPFI
jgi:hypothetical protein